MHVVYADTCFFIALCNPRDGLNKIATQWYSKLATNGQIVTTELVVVELLNYVADKAFGSRR